MLKTKRVDRGGQRRRHGIQRSSPPHARSRSISRAQTHTTEPPVRINTCRRRRRRRGLSKSRPGGRRSLAAAAAARRHFGPRVFQRPVRSVLNH